MTPAVKNTTHLMNKTLCSEKEPAKACNTQASIFDSSNSLVKNETDVFIQQKETEECTKKGKTKKILKIAGLIAFGVGVIIGSAILTKKFANKRNNKTIEKAINELNTKIANNPEEEIICRLNDYLKKHCNVYREAGSYSRIYTVIEANKGEMVDISRIGDLNKRGTILRYNTPEQAKQGAIKVVMKQFELPHEQQCELAVVTKGKDLYLNNPGGFDNAPYHQVGHCGHSDTFQDIEIFHNHPDCYGFGQTLPLSFGDIKTAMGFDRAKSVTAINSAGEFNTLIRTNASASDCQKISQWTRHDYYKDVVLIRLKNLRELSEKSKLTPEAAAELEMLDYYAKTNNYDLIKYTTDEYYAKIIHEAYKEIFPKYGFEYTTNYSNLKNI